MITLFTKEQFDSSKSRGFLPLQCEYCNNKFFKKKHYIQTIITKKFRKSFCSKKCMGLSNNVQEKVKCKQCNKEFFKRRSELKKCPNNFCSLSCSATYNNVNKTHGCRRSKLEAYLEKQLTLHYPTLEVHYNRKDAINSELDIYIPSLKLAFELNGIFHYEPIFGKEKLNRIKNNDGRKFQACLEKNIELCIIDTSKLSYFKEQNAIPYFRIISNIVNHKILPSRVSKGAGLPEFESGNSL